MTREEETLYIRMLQEAPKETLFSYLKLEKTETLDSGEVRFHFNAQADTGDEGYLIIGINEDKQVVFAEMNVGFPTMIGLNRSPLELRILAEHVIANIDF